MSVNVDRLRAGYEAFNRGDYETALDFMDPEVEFHRSERALDTRPLRGLDAVRQFMLPEVFDRQVVELDEVIENDAAGKMFVSLTFRVRGRGSGIELANHGYHVWTIRGDKAAHCQFFEDRGDALDAAGLER
jgi:ketosteroid isomerase-like protein